jgi:hypothetical protein
VYELERYKAVYCGLCRSVGRGYGLLARFTLNYDFAFLAMALDRETAPCPMSRRRCPAHPFRRRPMCQATPALELAAAESLILSYQKLRDDVADRGFFRGLPARVAARFLRRAYRRAAAARPAFDRAVTENLDRLHDLERERCPSMDRTADTFARILQAAAPDTGDDAVDRPLGQMLYHMGRWIYLIDAWDDLERDLREGGYNPLIQRYQGRPREHLEEVRATLRHSRNLAASAYALVKAERWDGILSNILYLGLPAIEESVFAGRWRRKGTLEKT